MKTRSDDDPVESRRTIRQWAFELADSSLLDGWNAIKRTLKARFETDAVVTHCNVSPGVNVLLWRSVAFSS
jgi:hypothetical protein